MPITTTSFVSVNVGTSANDGTGDELRNAFIKVNSNFSNISTVGFNSGNILVSGNVQAVYFVGDGSQLTNVSASNAYANANVAAYLVAYNGIVTASNVFVAGNVTSQWFLGQANLSSIITTDLGASGMIYANAGVNSTSTGTGALVVNGGVGITGNLTVGNLTVLGTQTVVSATSVAVANSFIFLSNNNITNVLDIGFVGQYAAGQGNVYTGLVRRASDGVYRLFSNLNPIPSTTINVANITLATLQLGNILAGNITGVINTPAQPYITSLGNLASLSSSGNITTTGYFFGNGSQLAGIVSYSNVYVATYLPTYSGNVANLTVATTLAGPTITAINSNVSVGNINMKNYVDGQITAANSAITSANLGLKGYVDNSVSTANIGMKGYVDAVASLSIYGNSNVKSYLTQFDGNLISNGNVAYNIGTDVNQWATVYANVVSAAYFTGNGALLTGIPAGYSNVQAATYLPTYSGNIANIRLGVTGTLTFADGTTMTTASVGGGSSYGNANVTAYTVSMGFTNFSNVNVAALITTNGLTNYSNVNVKAYTETMGFQNYGNVNVAALITTNELTNYSNVNVIAYLAGNITVGNISANGINANTVTATYNVTANTINALANVSIQGSNLNDTQAALQVLGFVNIQGNIDVYGRAQLGNIKLKYGTLLSDTSNGEFLVGGNITAGNISASGTSGKLGYTNGGFVQQITANSNGVSLNTVTGNIQLMGINLGVNGIHTVSFTNNKLEATDMILVPHHSGGVSNCAVGAYYAAPSTAIIWIRNITGADTSTLTPMLKFALIKAPGS